MLLAGLHPRPGHGGANAATSGDEPSGYNQTICPCDVDDKGEILDSEIYEKLVAPLPMVSEPSCYRAKSRLDVGCQQCLRS